MGRKSGHIDLDPEDREFLEYLQKESEKSKKKACRAKILLLRAKGMSKDQIVSEVGQSIDIVRRCIEKYEERGSVEDAIYDKPGRGRKRKYTAEEEEWVINTYKRNKELSLDKLTEHIHSTAERAGYENLSDIKRCTVNSIVKRVDISSSHEELPRSHRAENHMIIIHTLFRRKRKKKGYCLEYIKIKTGEAFSAEKEDNYWSVFSAVDLRTGEIKNHIQTGLGKKERAIEFFRARISREHKNNGDIIFLVDKNSFNNIPEKEYPINNKDKIRIVYKEEYNIPFIIITEHYKDKVSNIVMGGCDVSKKEVSEHISLELRKYHDLLLPADTDEDSKPMQ